MNAVTKSGTNAIARRPLLLPALSDAERARSAQKVARQSTRSRSTSSSSSAAASAAPSMKDKLFYFFTYDGSRKVNPISYTSTSSTFRSPVLAAIPAATCAAANSFVAVAVWARFPRFANQDVGFGKLDYQFTPAKPSSARRFNLDNFRAPNSYRTSRHAEQHR